jgi:GNAT superfamily N-acetyltransferase
MTAVSPCAAPHYLLPSCTLGLLQGEEEASLFGILLAGMEPWRTLGYSAAALQRYLLRPDATLYRHAVVIQGEISGVVCVRYPWLRGAYLELIGLTAAQQGLGIGREILSWIEAEARRETHNVWVLDVCFVNSSPVLEAIKGLSFKWLNW